jgi:hypothetical protein
MNRIAQRTFDPDSARRLVNDHALLISHLRTGVPPSILSLFAVPVLGEAGHVNWQSEQAGQPSALNSMTAQASEGALHKLSQRLQVVRNTLKLRHQQGELNATEFARLQQFIAQIPEQAVLVLGGEPVVLYSNSILPADQQQPLLPAAVLGASAVQSNTSGGRRTVACWAWFLALLLFLLALAALFWYFCPLSPRQAPSLAQDPAERLTLADVTIKLPAPTPVDPLDLWLAIPIPVAPPKACPEPEPCPSCPVCPELAPAPQTPVVPEPPPKAQVKPKPPPKKKVTLENANEFCPGERPAELAPEMVVVFDHSGSMRLNIATTAEQERDLMQGNPGDMLLQMLTGIPANRLSDLDREPRRITVAKDALSNVINRLPSDVSTGLVTVGQCPRAENRGFYTPQNRSRLLGQIQALTPEGGTPLANGILQAGNMLDGVKRESMILVITDGRESCGGDPCAIARSLAATKPHLSINVIDIGNSGAGNCLAANARGKVYTARSINELKVSLERATETVQGPKNCK